uniref:Cytochrome P450 CYP75B95 n=1 Tax=Picea glauca TaxID=3330 RepID=A0A0K8TU13_PICGL
MDASLELLQSSGLSVSLGQALSLILLSIGLICVVKQSLRKRLRLPPGPTGWPLIGSLPLLGNMPHHSLYHLSKQYGPIMYLKLGTTDTVVVSSPKIAEACLKTNDLNFSSRPGSSATKYIGYDNKGIVMAPYGPYWRMLRKICNIHLFAGKALDDLQPVRQAEVGMLLKSIMDHERQEKAVNLGDLLNICTANVLGQIMLSRRVFDSQGSTAGEFRGMVVEQMELAGKFIIGDLVPSLAWMDLQGLRSKMKNLHNRFDEFLSRMIKEHETASCTIGGRADFLSVLWALRNDVDGEGGKLTDTDIKALLLTLFTAGTDTTSSTVEWAIAELIRHPEMMRKCQQEIDSVMRGEQRRVKESDLQKLTYLQAVVKETFRLHPSTPLLLPRLAAEACEIEGYYIPKNARLMVNAWGMQRDPDVWERPLEFDPNRFVGSNVDVRGSDFQVIPFGAGRRICAGMSMGMRMVQLILATLLHSFDLSLPDGQLPEKLDMVEAFGLTMHKAVPLIVVPAARLPLHLYN